MLIIFTPTYNRKELLSRLYRSLLAQSNYQFTWLIVDDGSHPPLRDVVACWQQNAPFKIEYLYQNNQGKHGAYNTALDQMHGTDYHLVVDSDDTLAADAVQQILQAIADGESDSSLVGFMWEKTFPGAKPYSHLLPEKIDIAQLKWLMPQQQESALVISNRFLTNFRFKRFKNEKYMPEDPLYVFLASRGQFLVKTGQIYFCEYRADGLTHNVFKLWKRNPKGTLTALNARAAYIRTIPDPLVRLKEGFKTRLNIIALTWDMGGIRAVSKLGLKALCLLPLGALFHLHRFKGI